MTHPVPNQASISTNPVIAASLWMLGMVVGTALMMTLVKILAPRLHPLEILFFRALLAFPLFWLWARVTAPHSLHWPRRPGLVATRGVFTTLALAAFYWGLFQGIDLAQANALIFTTPIFLTVLGYFVFKEKVTLRRWAAVLAGFIGTIIVVQPDVNHIPPGALLILGSTLFWAVDAIMVKILARANTAMTVVLAQTFIMLVLSAPAAAFVWVTPTPGELFLLTVTGLLATFAQYAVTRALSMAEMSVLSPIFYSQLLLTATLGYLVFDEVPTLSLWIGAAIILIATFDILRSEARARKAEKGAGAHMTKQET